MAPNRSNNVQAFINNFTFPKNVDYLFACMRGAGLNQELFEQGGTVQWSGPRWAQIGDICLFHYGVTAQAYLNATRREYEATKNSYTKHEQGLIEEGFGRGEEDYQRIGGKTFAVSRVIGPVYHVGHTSQFSTPYFVSFGDIWLLENPISAQEYSDFLPISRKGAITTVSGTAFTRLRDLIARRNKIPEYYQSAISSPYPFTEVNMTNWLNIGLEHRRRFRTEEQFRHFYVDYLLKNLSVEGEVYAECAVYRGGIPKGFVDNVIKTDSGFLPVEVKLNISAEAKAHLFSQLDKYCAADKILLRRLGQPISAEIIKDRILVIDVNAIYLYRAASNTLEHVSDLDELSNLGKVQKLAAYLGSTHISGIPPISEPRVENGTPLKRQAEIPTKPEPSGAGKDTSTGSRAVQLPVVAARDELDKTAKDMVYQDFRAKGWEVELADPAKPYSAIGRNGDVEIYIVAKGAADNTNAVAVTESEVAHARANLGNCFMGIVSGIQIDDDGAVVENSGTLRVMPWNPNAGTLTSTQYRWVPPN